MHAWHAAFLRGRGRVLMNVKHGPSKHAHMDESVDTAAWCAGFVHASAGAEYSFSTPLAGSYSERVKLWVDNEMLIDQWTSLDHFMPSAHWKSSGEAEYHSLEMEYTCSTSDLTSLAGCGYSLEWMPFSIWATGTWAVVPAANLAIKKPDMCRNSEFLPDISLGGTCVQLSDTEFACPSECEYEKHEPTGYGVHWSCECSVRSAEECAPGLPLPILSSLSAPAKYMYTYTCIHTSACVSSPSQTLLRIVARMRTQKWAPRTRTRQRPCSYRMNA